MVRKQERNLYERIVLCGIQSLNASELRYLQSLSVQSIQLLADQQALRAFNGYSVECLIVSLDIKITSEELERLPNLKTIVVFGSSIYDMNSKLAKRSRLKLLNVLDKKALQAWLHDRSGYMFLDSVAARYSADILPLSGVINCGVPAYKTPRSRDRLHQRVLELVEESLEDHHEHDPTRL